MLQDEFENYIKDNCCSSLAIGTNAVLRRFWKTKMELRDVHTPPDSPTDAAKAMSHTEGIADALVGKDGLSAAPMTNESEEAAAAQARATMCNQVINDDASKNLLAFKQYNAWKIEYNKENYIRSLIKEFSYVGDRHFTGAAVNTTFQVQAAGFIATQTGEICLLERNHIYFRHKRAI